MYRGRIGKYDEKFLVLTQSQFFHFSSELSYLSPFYDSKLEFLTIFLNEFSESSSLYKCCMYDKRCLNIYSNQSFMSISSWIILFFKYRTCDIVDRVVLGDLTFFFLTKINSSQSRTGNGQIANQKLTVDRT